MELIVGDKIVIGGSIVGTPFIATGMNNYVAWSATLSYEDGSDFFEEKVNENRTKYYYDGKWRNLLNWGNEKIKIKNEIEPYEFDLLATHHGPLLSMTWSFFSNPRVTKYNTQTSIAWGGLK